MESLKWSSERSFRLMKIDDLTIRVDEVSIRSMGCCLSLGFIFTRVIKGAGVQ